jgi:hypothetical protein
MEEESMTPKELYPSLVQMIINAENITWNRFYNFLMFNTILVLSWATLWTAASAPHSRPVVLVAICILGSLSGIFWAALGYRGRAFISEFMNMAKEFEADSAVWSKDLEKYRQATKAIELRDSLGYSWAGSRVLLIGGPLAFTVLYGVLLVISF